MTDSYRKKFPKGKDWEDPKSNPYGFAGLNENSYHGTEVVAISIEKHNEIVKELEAKILELETDLYFERRNRRISEMYDDR